MKLRLMALMLTVIASVSIGSAQQLEPDRLDFAEKGSRDRQVGHIHGTVYSSGGAPIQHATVTVQGTGISVMCSPVGIGGTMVVN
ncbi:MAG: hypothetical protein Q8J62_10285 [Candidatus Cloacimonadaceae bacterium]|nr:hypothetical protein [Candidatus Cloacimonadaceae bacterium]